MGCFISPFCSNDSVLLLQAKTRTSGGWRPCGHCRDRAGQHGSSLLPMPRAMRAPWGKACSCSDWGLSSSSKRAPQNTPTGSLDNAHKCIQTIHSKIPNVHAFFFNHLISLRSQFGLNISKASFKTAVQCFGVFCSGPLFWSLCPPLDVETPLPF